MSDFDIDDLPFWSVTGVNNLLDLDCVLQNYIEASFHIKQTFNSYEIALTKQNSSEYSVVVSINNLGIVFKWDIYENTLILDRANCGDLK